MFSKTYNRSLLAAVGVALSLLTTVVPVRSSWADPSSLKVALYPYVPRLSQFQETLKAEWAKVQPGISLEFVPSDQWDGGYDKDPQSDFDVFVFDAMMLEFFRSKNYLSPLSPAEVANLGDLLGYARDGVQYDGAYYGIPMLGCGEMLFYSANDAELHNAKTFSDVRNTLKQCTYTSKIPPDRRGLMVDMSGGTTNAGYYLEIAYGQDGVYPLPQPPDPQALKKTAIDNLRAMLAMGSFLNAEDGTDTPYIRARWFEQGYGRAYIGYTESMSSMNPQTLNSIEFKPMPYADSGRYLFFADVIGINSTTAARGTRTAAVQLANVMASPANMTASIGPDGGSGPQYLLPARWSVFDTLKQVFPVYQTMQNVVLSSNPLLFKLDANARDWLKAMKKPIKAESTVGYACGCDYQSATPIADNADAQSKCPLTCSAHGGWNGQWTNQAPTPGSVCGCNSCPIGN